MSEEVSENRKELTVDSWEVDDALRTLTRAEEIKQNNKLMELVSKKAATKKKVLDDLAAKANSLYPTMKEN